MSEQALTPDPHPYPTRSKMIDTYLADIAWKLATAQVGQARTLAVRLPHIGVALSNAELHSSAEAYQRWCMNWVEPERSADEYAQWFQDAGETFAALQSLRLRRSLREIAAPQIPAAEALPPVDREAAEECEALLQAARKWYAQVGRHHPVVQTNLARLGVLR